MSGSQATEQLRKASVKNWINYLKRGEFALRPAITVVCYEDLVEALISVKLLALSRHTNSPDVPLHYLPYREKILDAFRMLGARIVFRR